MKFVTIRHPDLGVTTVPESRVPFLSKGWEVVEAEPDTDPAVDDAPVYEPVQPTKRASRARKSPKES